MSLRVTGVRELQRAARDADKAKYRLLRERLKRVGDIVREDAADDLGDLNAYSAAGLRVYVRQRGVSVEQSRRRTTGKRGDWGARQMRILISSLDEREDDVVQEAERAVDDIARIFDW